MFRGYGQTDPAPGREPGSRVPRQVRLISVLILAFVFASVACLGLYLSRQQLHSRLQSEALRLQSAFAVAQSDIEQNMLILAAMVAADPEVQRLFRDGKAAVQAEGGGPGGERARRARQALMDHVAPQWRSMQAQFALRQLHFHLGPGSLSFLRVHTPEKFGDRMDDVRHIIAAVNKDGQPRTGFETGRIYSGVRGVVAVRDEQAPGRPVIGALEAGTSFDTQLARLDGMLGAGFAILLKQEHVDQNVWQDYLKLNGVPGQGSCKCYLEAASRPEIQEWMRQGDILRPLASRLDSSLLTWQGRDYQLVRYPLYDYLHKVDPGRPHVGAVVIWLDRTQMLAEQAQLENRIVLGAVLSFAVVTLLLFWGLGITRRRLEARIQAATQALEDERRLFVGGPVLTLVWQPEGGWPVRYVSENVRQVLGYSPAEMMAAGRKFEDFIHPDDRDRLSQKREGLIERREHSWEQRYRLLRQNGEVRWFLDFTVAEQDAEGRLRQVRGYLIDQTGQVELETRLRAEEERLELALAGADLGMWEWDVASGTASWDARAYEMLGYAPDAFPVNPDVFKQMVHPRDSERVTDQIQTHLSRAEGFVVEFRIRRADDRWIWVESRGKAVTWHQGEPVRLMGTFTDISVRKQAELALQASEARQRTLIASMNELLLAMDASGFLREVHQPRGFFACFDDLQEQLGRDYRAYLPEAVAHALDDAIAGVIRTLEAQAVSFSLPVREGGSTGEVRHFHAQVSALADGEPYPTGYLLMVRDISDSVRTQQALRQLATRNAAILEGAGEGIYGVDREDRCIFINQAALDMLGIQESGVLGQDTHTLFHHHDETGGAYRPADCPVTHTLQDGQLRRVENEWFWRQDGVGFPVSMTVAPLIEDGEQTGAVVLFQDQSLRRAQEQALRHLASTDPLTGLPNRRYFMERLEQEWSRLNRFGGQAAIMMLDLDHFKQVNDNYGHGVGDQVLVAFAEVLRQGVRRMDVPGRLGGEEFAVILPGASLDGARQLAERLRRAVSQMPVQDALGQPVRVTVSIGVASFDPETPVSEALLTRGDEALYRAKALGRNRVEVSLSAAGGLTGSIAAAG